MSADPTAPPARPRPAPTVEPLVEFVRTQRANAAYALLGLAVAFLAGAIWLANKGERSAPPAEPPAVNPLDPTAPPTPPPEVDSPKKSDYRFGWIFAAIGGLIAGGAGATLLAAAPKPTEAAQRSWARGFVLAVGALLGAALILAGTVYFYRWYESLTKWLDAGDKKEMQYVVVPLLMVVAGAGLVFAAIQPARAEERNNQTLRRLVYGANLGLTVLLLFVGLVIANVVFSLKVQSILDTTETGFYTLSDATKQTVGRLAEPVTAHVILPDNGARVVNDIRQLMYSAQEASGGKLTARFVSPVTNKGELQQLQEKYPKLEKSSFGILLTAGDDGKRSEFIPASDLIKEDFRPGGGRQESFVGEGAVVQKLRFLADSDVKPVVYFTQGHGELALAAGGDAGFGKADREATQLKGYLDGLNLDVRPLELKEGGKAEVPADAAVVVVADPVTPLPDAGVKALKDYMSRPGDKKGKLVILAEARAGGKGRKMAKTGVEGLAAEFGVKIGEQFVYSVPIPQYGLSPKDSTVVFAVSRDGTGHPLAQPFGRMQMVWSVPREVAPAGGPGGPFTATPVLQTAAGRPSWLEDELLDNPLQTFRDMVENESLLARKQITQRSRPLGVAVTEGGAPNPMNPHDRGGAQTPRVVVYANGEIFSNDAPRVKGGGTPPSYELMGATIDWLRDRPPIAPGIDAKTYTTYTLPAAETLSETRLIWLPLGLAMFAVAGLGAGVWVIRRK